ncbi:MAG: PTS sugar transporter subunit IIA [Propionicimonas sp.]|uniref:PTS sugar transporter subunit IIA n=1 Tax=Propionicimonas sp. TaxID=1955623 RepID=UPI003D10F08B
MYFSESIVLLQDAASDRDEALRRLAGEFVSRDLVLASFPDAVLDREQRYPTGLDLGDIAVAIPHTDAEHVRTDQLGFMSLQNPVTFRQMGDDTATAEVSLVIMLALHKTEDQIPMLQKLVELIQDRTSIDTLRTTTSPLEVVETFARAGLR